jgi:hypothetical protein
LDLDPLNRFQCPPWPPRWPAIERAALHSLRSGHWGRYRTDSHDRLRVELAQRFESEHVRLCGSGTAAMEIALRAAGVGPGDEVVVAALDYPGNFRAIELVGARPVLVDVQEDGLGISEQVTQITQEPQIKAVVVSHLYGHAAPVGPLRESCDRQGWLLIEDACQTPGMRIGGRPAGSFGHLATLSFGGSKTLTAGCGGAVLTSDPRLAARINAALDRPSDASPLSALQASVLMPQLERLDECNERRRKSVIKIAATGEIELRQWRVLAVSDPEVVPAYYKLAFAASGPQQVGRVVDAAPRFGLPIGKGFRSMDRSSERRCRKPVPLPRSKHLGETVFVLDHAALLADDRGRQSLCEALIRLHDQTAG